MRLKQSVNNGLFFPEMVVLALSNILVCIFIVFLVLFTYQKSGAESQKVSVALLNQ